MKNKPRKCCLSWCDNPASDDSGEGLCSEHLKDQKRKRVKQRWRDALDLDTQMSSHWLDAPDA